MSKRLIFAGLRRRLQSASQPAPLSSFFQNGAELNSGDENICCVQEAVVGPQAAGSPPHPSAVPASTLHSAGEGE